MSDPSRDLALNVSDPFLLVASLWNFTHVPILRKERAVSSNYSNDGNGK